MSDKDAIRTSAIVTGVSGGLAIHHWSEYAAFIEMALYSMAIVLIFLFSFWTDRRRPRFWIGTSIVLLLHGVALFFIRSYFPFRTILTVVPMLFAEAIVLIIIMLRVLGDDEPEKGAIKPHHTHHQHPK
jgi:hypothetical protein